MANFRSDDRNGRDSGNRERPAFRGRSGGRGGFSGGSRGGFGGGGFARRPLEMHDVICDKCGKECQVPFKPSGDKPVLCSDCFRQSEGGSSGRSFGPRGRSSGSGVSSEQLTKIEAKLDKIIKALKIDSAE